jgi:hypothetical protein
MRVTRRRNRGGTGTGNRIGAVLLGALAGMAVGILLADRGQMTGRRQRRKGTADDMDDAPSKRPARPGGAADIRPFAADRAVRTPVNDDAELEARVLETFRNDPILMDRPIDIGAIGTGIIELTGWVDVASEVRLATTLTRGTVGVHTVVNRLLVRGDSPAI